MLVLYMCQNLNVKNKRERKHNLVGFQLSHDLCFFYLLSEIRKRKEKRIKELYAIFFYCNQFITNTDDFPLWRPIWKDLIFNSRMLWRVIL